MPMNRQEFLSTAATAGTALSSGLGARLGRAAGAAEPARLIVDPARTLAPVPPYMFGSFLEHIGRAIYTGVFEPGSPLADEQGFRKDVADEIRQLGVPMVRWPGGNFVSGYNWLDGVGPKEKRPQVLDRAWNSLETNQFGTNEFMAWCKAVGTKPLVAVNLGSGKPAEAAAWVEYCNVEKGGRWADLRVQHGVAAPHDVRHWCLGNEMDGPWQIGHIPAVEYGRKAADAARQMRAVDKSIQLIACGSSGPMMPTYLEWDRQVLMECYNDVDGISLHRYFNKPGETGNDSGKFLALNRAMENQIREVTAVCDFVGARLKSRKQLWLAFDEWNVWYRTMNPVHLDGRRRHAPPLVEETYSLEDALLVGGLVNSLLRQTKRVRIGCLAQLVNVIAPLMTNEKRVLRQTIYYPYAWGLKFARGDVLDLWLESPSYRAGDLGDAPYLDAAGTLDRSTGEASLFILNRDLEKERELKVTWRESPPDRLLAGLVLTGNDLKATNNFEHPDRVVPRDFPPPRPGPVMTFKLPPRSYGVFQYHLR